MKSLIIDTTLDKSYIIFSEESELLAFKTIEGSKNLSSSLLPALEELLKQTDTDLSNLKYIATSIGPGSYTGIRVGASICKTISYTKNIPLIGYISMLAYAPQDVENFKVLFDAKSENVFVYENGFEKPKLIEIDDFLNQTHTNNTIILSPQESLIERLNEKKENSLKFQKISFDPKNLLKQTNFLFDNKKFENGNNLRLLYLKGPNHVDE
ncbi:MAG: tRNA (adenosine(37)-N6)-threonylcarbamoyltransferase complex dimerization subunit type 1 TsaB [Parachlamydiales bacterium]|nr:tRNA (adenosine(37)-N6)-threonylcarbamoyltransferase complex dimerization subunit type 1 TsaB [Parachlamydiales bacterium]